MNLREEFPKRLREALKHYGWTQTELSRRLGISNVMVNFLTTGQRLPSFQTFKKLLNVFWYTPADFFVGRTETICCAQFPFKQLKG